ncbi:DUF6194 family protein [Micromonospora sp. NPDC047548]|uniref:DUF6194 family protein n=1 Tax=Micromonospora sp. NPDC047548 TaxID=3155624 RepID=UPI0033CF58B8
MDTDDMKRHISDSFEGVAAVDGGDDTYFVYDPLGDLPADRWLPFATIVTGDHHDTASALDRPGAWRLNIGLTRARYASVFATAPAGGAPVDHTVTDTLLPHPVYAPQHWVCVVNPGPATRELVGELLADAYGFAVRKHLNQRRRRPGSAD